MDNTSLQELIYKIPELKFKYSGSFSPEYALSMNAMPLNSFQIVNTTNNSQGEHWVAIVKNYNGSVVFGDSLGKSVKNYPDLEKRFHGQKSKTLVNLGPVQSTPDMCGFYAVYFAFMVLQNRSRSNVSEYDLFKFLNKYYKF